jgi:outer membrane protein assembly factor BamB/fibronectin type 3 domain-containing protein
LINDLTSVFIDKENDQLFFDVSSGSDSVTTVIQNTMLSVNLLAENGSVEEIIVSSSDGQLTTADTFNLAFVQWGIRISADNDSVENNNNFIGVAAQATAGHDPEFEQPVDDENELSVYFEHSDWLPDSSAYFDQDIRSLIALDDTSHAWTFDVISAAAADVSLNFDFFDYPGFPAKVVDLETGEEQPLDQDTEILFTAYAAESRSFQVYVGDVVPPAAVTDLAVDSALSRSMILQWSAPGDDGLAGTAVSYEIRYALDSITTDNFTNAILVTDSVPLPDSSGQLQTVEIADLEPQTEYYFALKATDDAGNQSLISNIISQSALAIPLTELNAYWGKFHNDLLNSGYTSQDGATLDTLLWYYETSGDINSPPVVDDRGEVYFGSEDGSVYALKVDGTLKWSYATGGGVTAAPLVSTLDRLYVGSKSGVFYCFNRTTGDTIWTYQANDQIYSSATIDSSGRLFFADLDGQVYCLDSEFGKLYWQATVGNRIYSTPAFSPSGSIVYVGGFDKNVYALDADSGSVQWNYATNGYILSSMAVDGDGVIYVSSSDMTLYALNPDGTLKWSYTTGGAIWYSSPALGTDNDVYIGSDDNKLYSVNRSDGTLRWSYTTSGDVRNSPAVTANSYIYFGSMDNSLYQVDTSGALVSSVQFGGQIQTSSVGIGIGGIIYIGTYDQRLYAYGVGDTIPPVTPAEFSAFSDDHNVILSWTANTEPDMYYYNIYRSEVSGFDPSPSDSLTQVWKSITSYTDSAVTNGETYYYSIKAIDITGNKSSASAEVVGTPTNLPPAAPTELATDAGDSRITLNWKAGDEYDLAGHIIYRSTDSTFVPTSEDSIVTIPLPEISFVDSGLVIGITYYYQLAAYDYNGNVSQFSDQVLSVPLDLTAPLAPEGIVIQNGDGDVTLTWTANTELDLNRYQIYLNMDSSFVPTSSDLLASIPAPAVTYTDTGLINGFTYYYLLTAIDTSGNESAASRLIIGTPTDHTPPVAPVGLLAESGDHFVDLTWTANVEYDLSYYIIYRSEVEGFEPESVDSLTLVSKTVTSFRDTSVTNGVIYYYRLKAGDIGDNIGLASDAVIGTPTDLPPGAPTEFAAAIGDGRITLNWTTGSEYDLVGHIIYRSNDSTFVPTRDDSIADVLLPEISYVDSGLVTGLTYYYQLSSYDLGGNESLFSEQVFGAPVDLTAPLTPQDIVVLNGEKQVTLTWQENTETDLDRYHIYRNSDSSFVPTSSALLVSIPAPAETYTDTGLSNGYIYYYLLTAIDTTGNESAASELLTGAPTDLTPPAAITDLEIVNFTSNTIKLRWTATGGDSTIGRAYAYDLKFSTQALSEANFDEADSITTNVPNPGMPGTLENVNVTGLDPSTRYFFAVKAIDSTGNVSTISNMVSQKTKETPVLLSTSLWGKFHYDNQNTGRSPIYGTNVSSKVWSYETGDDVNSPPVLDDRGDVYFGSEDGSVYALNVDGTLKWSYATGDGVSAAPLVTSMDRLYVGSKSGVFYCFNRSTGDTIWTYTASDEIIASAVINDKGRLFFGDQDGNLTSLDSEFGSLYWEASVGNRIYSSPALSPDENTVYVGGHDKNIYALDVLTGEVQWNYSTNGYILSSMAVDEEGVIYASSYDRKLYAINPDGSLKWTYSTSGAILYSSPALGTDNDIYIGSNDNKLHSVNRSDGSLRWKFNTNGDVRNSPAVTVNGNIFFGSTDNKIYAVDQDGNLVWNYSTTGQIQTSSAAIGPNGNVYIGSNDNNLYLIGELDTIPPSAPTNFIAAPGDERVILSWDMNPENDLARYIVYKGLTAATVQLYDSVGFVYNTFVDSSVENNTEYFYSIKAVDQLANRSPFTAVESTTPYDQTPPPAPSGLTAVPGDSEISVSWDPLYNIGDFLNYHLYVMEQDSSFTLIESTSITGDPISDAQDTEVFLTNLQNKTTYHLAVTAVDTFLNESEYSTIVSSTPYAGPVWYVGNDGDNNNIGYITDPFFTIEYAIDYASDDDTVMVLPGTYVENIVIDGKSIVLSGLGNPESIIVDGNQAGNVLNIVDLNFSGISVSVENMTITNGNSEKGGGIFVEEVSANLDRLIISGNSASASGGGVFIQGLGGTISNTLFVNNSALNGAGLATEGWSDVSVWNSTINGNIASNTGGGIYCTDNSVIQVVNCIISDNDTNQVAVGSSTEPGSILIDYSNIAGGETDILIINGTVNWGTHNFDVVESPFVSRSTNDFSLSDYSQLMGQGSNDLGISSDLYGHLRPNPAGSNPDLGAIESALASQRPKSGAVFDGGPTDLDWFSDSTIIAHWESFVDDSTVSYQTSVGSYSDTLDNIFNWATTGQDTFFTMNLTNVTAGVNYYVSVRGLDIDNQMSDTTTSNGFMFDFILPTVTNIIEVQTDSSDRDYFNDSINLNFTWSGNDNESGLDYFEYALALDDSIVLDWSFAGTDTAAVIDSFALVEGQTYHFKVRATDIAGNQSEIGTGDGFLIDYTPPTTGFVFDGLEEADIMHSGSDSTVNAHWSTFSDSLSGIDYYEYAIGFSVQGSEVLDWTSGVIDTFVNVAGLELYNGETYYVSIRAVDHAGNVSSVVSSNGLTVDTEPPGQGFVKDGSSTDQNWYNQDTTLTAFWTGFSDDLSGVKEYTISIGTNAGLEDVMTWTNVGSDTTATFDSLELAETITYFFNVIASDSVGNVGTVVSSNGITIDLAAPSTYMNIENFYIGPDRWNNENPLVGTSGDDLSGIQSIELMVNRKEDNYFWSDGGWTLDSSWVKASGDISWNYQFILSNLGDGQLYQVYAHAVDSAGNKDLSPALDSLVYDSSLPESFVQIELEFYNNLSWNADSSITGTATDSISGIDSVLVAVERLSDNQWFDGTQWQPFELWQYPLGLETWYFQLPENYLNDSISYNIYSKAFDLAGNQQLELGSSIIAYDVSIPATGQVYDGTEAGIDIDWSNINNFVSAFWTGFDDIISGISQYEYMITEVSLNTVVPWTSVGVDTFVVDTSLSLETGMQYFVSVRATDGANNLSLEAMSDGVTVDTIAPVIIYIYEGSFGNDLDFQYDNTSLSVAWGGSDSRVVSRDISDYAVSLGSAPGLEDIVNWVDVSSNMNHVFDNLNLEPDSTYYANVKAYDQAGNISGTMSGDGITIDQTAPVAGLVADFELDDVDWTSIDFQILAYLVGFSDSLSGVAEYWVSIGLSPGLTQVLDWTSNGSNTNFAYVVDLVPGPTYYVNAYAIDAVGNVSTTVSSDGFGVDLDSPVAGTVFDGQTVDLDWTNNDSTQSANWSGFSDATSSIANYEYSIGTSAGSQNITPWTLIPGSSITVTQDSLNLNHGTTYFFNLHAYDEAENVSQTISSNGITIDTEMPLISQLTEGSPENPVYQASDDSLALYCNANDNLSGIGLYQFAVGSAVGDSDIVAWTEFTSENSSVIFEPLVLNNGSVYYGQVRVFDQAGNSDMLEGDGVIIDATPPISGSVIDLTDLSVFEDQDLTNSTTTLSAFMSGFIDTLSGIERYEYAVGTSELNTDVKDWSLTDNDTLISDNTLTLEHTQTYYVAVRAFDVVGNMSSIISSNGITVDEFAGPPVIESMSIEPGSWISSSFDTEIDLQLSEPVQDYNVSITTNIESGYTIDTVYTADPPQIHLTLIGPFAALDSVAIGIHDLTDLLGFEAVDTFFTYITPMIGDFNTDNSVDILDLNQFVIGWQNQDYNFETGPVEGEIPYFIPNINSVFDLRDVMAFTRMWHWSNNTPTLLLAEINQFGPQLDIKQSGKVLEINLTDDVSSGQVLVLYDQTKLEIENTVDQLDQDVMLLKNHYKDEGNLLIEKAYLTDDEEKHIYLETHSLGEEDSYISIQYIFLDRNNNVISQGFISQKVIAVPDEFALHHNYPNPFNPVTTIQYDIPVETHVNLIVYDILGREVKTLLNQKEQPGYKSIRWNGKNNAGQKVSAGMYFYRFETTGFVDVHKMILLK